MTGLVIVEAKGTCKDDVQVTGQGSGDSPATATTAANQQITFQCASRGGVKSFDSATIISDTRPSSETGIDPRCK